MINVDKLPSGVQIVTNPYENKLSENRQGVMISGEWTEAISRFVLENNVKAVYLNSARGWIGDDYSFLSRLDSVEELNIISAKGVNLNAIEQMTSLVEISITCVTKEKIDFTKLPYLSKCFLHWWAGAESILSCQSLSSLYLDKVKFKDCSQLSQLTNLQALTISSSSTLDSLEWLAGLNKLEELTFYQCKKIMDFTPITQCQSLKKLVISNCKQLENIAFVSELTTLEVLEFSGDGELLSLSPLAGLNNLKALSFPDNTVIKDGDLAMLETLPQLAMLMFQPRKHYSHKLIKPWSWKNFNQPDALLKAK